MIDESKVVPINNVNKIYLTLDQLKHHLEPFIVLVETFTHGVERQWRDKLYQAFGVGGDIVVSLESIKALSNLKWEPIRVPNDPSVKFSF